jgi:hypothetical protein
MVSQKHMPTPEMLVNNAQNEVPCQVCIVAARVQDPLYVVT